MPQSPEAMMDYEMMLDELAEKYPKVKKTADKLKSELEAEMPEDDMADEEELPMEEESDEIPPELADEEESDMEEGEDEEEGFLPF